MLWANPYNPYVWIVLAVTLSYGLIGFYDDYLKVTKRTSSGFSGRLRLGLELLIAGLATYAMSVGRRKIRDGADRALLQGSGHRSWAGPVRLPWDFRDLGRGQRRKSHRRPGWARHRARDDRGIGLRRDRLSGRTTGYSRSICRSITSRARASLPSYAGRCLARGSVSSGSTRRPP